MSKLIHYVRRLVISLLGAALLWTPFSIAQAQEDTETQAQNTAEVSYEAPDDLQTELPQEPAVEFKEQKTVDLGFLAFLGPILKLIFYALIAAAIGFIIYSILKEIIRVRRNMRPKTEDEDAPAIPDYQPDEETARILLADAEKLAAEGKYAEAVHIILFRSIQDIQDKRPHHVKNSLTSREISQLPILSQKAREGFSMIGRLVENSFFGGGALSQADYAASVSTYKNFAFERKPKARKR